MSVDTGAYEKRAEDLSDRTSLKRRESEVWALKEQDMTHEEIAEVLGISKSTVDEYSRRIRNRVKRAEATLDEVDI